MYLVLTKKLDNKCINFTAGLWHDFQVQSIFGNFGLKFKFCALNPCGKLCKTLGLLETCKLIRGRK